MKLKNNSTLCITKKVKCRIDDPTYFRTQLYTFSSLDWWPSGVPRAVTDDNVIADICAQGSKLDWKQLYDEVLVDRLRYQVVMRDPAARLTALTHPLTVSMVVIFSTLRNMIVTHRNVSQWAILTRKRMHNSVPPSSSRTGSSFFPCV